MMFVARAARTMATAKPKIVVAEPPMDFLAIRTFRRSEEIGTNKQVAQEIEAKLAAEVAKHKAKVAELASMLGAANRVLSKGIDFETICRRICRATGVSRSQIISRQRSRHVVLARMAVMYWAARRTTLSMVDIGRRLDRDHTTIIHGKEVYPQKRAAAGRYLRVVR